MENLFRIVSAEELAATRATGRATGLVPRCPSDQRSNCIHLNIRADVEKVASLYFSACEAPVALEIRRSDIVGWVAFAPPTAEKPFQQVALHQPNILLSWVVAVHLLEWVESAGKSSFRFVDKRVREVRSPVVGQGMS